MKMDSATRQKALIILGFIYESCGRWGNSSPEGKVRENFYESMYYFLEAYDDENDRSYSTKVASVSRAAEAARDMGRLEYQLMIDTGISKITKKSILEKIDLLYELALPDVDRKEIKEILGYTDD